MLFIIIPDSNHKKDKSMIYTPYLMNNLMLSIYYIYTWYGHLLVAYNNHKLYITHLFIRDYADRHSMVILNQLTFAPSIIELVYQFSW